MQTERITVLDQALALPTQQCPELVDALLSSLSGLIAPEIDRAWRQEAQRRAAQIAAGAACTIDGEEALARPRAKYRSWCQSVNASRDRPRFPLPSLAGRFGGGHGPIEMLFA